MLEVCGECRYHAHVYLLLRGPGRFEVFQDRFMPRVRHPAKMAA